MPVPETTVADLARALSDGRAPVLLDVRSHGEHLTVALPGSILIPLPELAERLDELEEVKGRPIVAYCHRGIRSRSATALLRAAGFPEVSSLRGGIDAWAREVAPGMARY